MNIRNVCASKDTINRVKRQPTEWDRIFANGTLDKGFISKILKELMQLNIINKQTKSKKKKKGQI